MSVWKRTTNQRDIKSSRCDDIGVIIDSRAVTVDYGEINLAEYGEVTLTNCGEITLTDFGDIHVTLTDYD